MKKALNSTFWLLHMILLAAVSQVGCTGLTVAGHHERTDNNIDQALLTRGRKQFVRCVGCHSMDPDEPNMLGPHLDGIVGRMSASVESYSYTTGIRDMHFVWDEARLDVWLENPRDPVPELCETFNGMTDAEKRRALIVFLGKSL